MEVPQGAHLAAVEEVLRLLAHWLPWVLAVLEGQRMQLLLLGASAQRVAQGDQPALARQPLLLPQPPLVLVVPMAGPQVAASSSSNSNS